MTARGPREGKKKKRREGQTRFTGRETTEVDIADQVGATPWQIDPPRKGEKKKKREESGKSDPAFSKGRAMPASASQSEMLPAFVWCTCWQTWLKEREGKEGRKNTVLLALCQGGGPTYLSVLGRGKEKKRGKTPYPLSLRERKKKS